MTRTARAFQVLAVVTGINLLLLTAWCVNRYVLGFNMPSWTDLIGALHGWFYMAYAFVTLKLSVDLRWNWKKTVSTLLSGTIPFCSFIAERRRTAEFKTAASASLQK